MWSTSHHIGGEIGWQRQPQTLHVSEFHTTDKSLREASANRDPCSDQPVTYLSGSISGIFKMQPPGLALVLSISIADWDYLVLGSVGMHN